MRGNVAVVAMLAILAVAACDDGSRSAGEAASGPPPPPVSVARPIVRDVVDTDEFTGRFDAAETVEVRARVNGYLEAVHFKDGAIVAQGDVLFTIDPRPYQAAVERARASVVVAETRLRFASSELQRAEALRRTGNVPERTVDERQQDFLAAQAELNGAKAALEQARLDFGFTRIEAPIAGRISRKFVSEGNLVIANDTVLTRIVSLDPIHFYFDVDERSFLRYLWMDKEGARPSGRSTQHEVVVTLADERLGKRRGHLDFVDNRIDPETGTMRGRAVLANSDLVLTPGLFGRAEVPGSGSYRGILIPDEAIASDLDRRIVYVLGPDNTVDTRTVRPGPRIDGYRVVRTGLRGDELIVVNGLMRLRPGMRIEPQLTTLPPTRS
jgi:RND family efflux transporter MFP subunit